KRNPMSQMFARQAWALLSKSFAVVMKAPDDLEARGNMQLGAHLAGAAIETSMLGAAHATANPLSAHFDMVHGIAVGVMLPHVIRWNIPEVGHLYRDLAISAGWAGRGDTAEQAAETLAKGFAELVAVASMPQTLTDALELQLNDKMRDTLVEEATQQWTGTFNPRTMDADGFRQLYRNAT
ncbi:MAG: iron-containing alcohol dehydrogenase, partial [Fuerstiella sp.]